MSLVIGPSDYFRLVYKRRPLNRNPDNKCDRGAVICFETSVQAINQSINLRARSASLVPRFSRGHFYDTLFIGSRSTD